MVNWQSIQEVNKEAAILFKMVFVLLGLYMWEVATSFQFELDFFTGKKKFKWPLIFYFLCRYLPLVHLTAFISQIESPAHPINCAALYTTMHFASHGSVALSSINLALRTMAVWSEYKAIKVALTILILGHWALIGAVSTYSFHSQWIPGVGCNPAPAKITGMMAICIYTLAFDLLVLGLTLYKLLDKTDVSVPKREHGHVRYILFTQGVNYFAITSFLSLISLVFYILDLNKVMIVIISTPTLVIDAMLACRMVRALTSFAYSDEELVLRFTKADTNVPNLSTPAALRFRHTITGDSLIN